MLTHSTILISTIHKEVISMVHVVTLKWYIVTQRDFHFYNYQLYQIHVPVLKFSTIVDSHKLWSDQDISHTWSLTKSFSYSECTQN